MLKWLLLMSRTKVRRDLTKVRSAKTSANDNESRLCDEAQLRTMAPRGWPGCEFCGGSKGCPRASPNAVRCTAGECKTALTAKRAAGKAGTLQAEASQAAAGDDEHEMMPGNMWVHELEEILGERCCIVKKLSAVQRKCGPRGKARQQFLVRGKFLQEVDSDDEDEDDEPALDTFWVDQSDLLSTIAVDDIEEALEARQDAVVAGLRPAKKARK